MLSARQVVTVAASSADVTPTCTELLISPILDLHTLCPATIHKIIFLRLFLPQLSAIITLSVTNNLDLSAAYQNYFCHMLSG